MNTRFVCVCLLLLGVVLGCEDEQRSTESEMLRFEIQNQKATIDTESKKVSLKLPYGAELDSLIPNIKVSPDASVEPRSGTAQDFTKPLRYSVISENCTFTHYQVSVELLPNKLAKLHHFIIGNDTLAIKGQEVRHNYPRGTDLRTLKPRIVISEKATVSPASGVYQDFSKPVNYTIIAQDGITRTSFKVLLSHEASPEASINQFSVGATNYTINGTDITYTYPAGTDVSALSPTISVSTGATVSPSSGVVQNFSTPKTYTVTAADGTTKSTYTVRVEVAANSAAAIQSFKVGGQAYQMQGTTIGYIYPYGTDVSALSPTIILSPGASVSPASGVVQNFSTPKTYTVTAADGTSKSTYTVQVQVDKNSEAAIKTFQVGSKSFQINGSSITATYPHGTDVSALTPTISLSAGAKVSPKSGVPQNFGSPVTYSVTSEDGNAISSYRVEVQVAAAPVSPPTTGHKYPASGSFGVKNGSWVFIKADGTHQPISTSLAPVGNTVAEIIHTPYGYMIASAPDNQVGLSTMRFFNKDLTTHKDVKVPAVNVSTNRYAIIGDKLYYTNQASILAGSVGTNRVIEFNMRTMSKEKEASIDVLQLFADGAGQLYYLNGGNELHKIPSNDITNLATTKLATFTADLQSRLVLDKNGVFWGVYIVKKTVGFRPAEGPVSMVRYKLNDAAGARTANTSTKYNGHSQLKLNQDGSKVYLTAFHTFEKRKELAVLEDNNGIPSLKPLITSNNSSYEDLYLRIENSTKMVVVARDALGAFGPAYFTYTVDLANKKFIFPTSPVKQEKIY